MMGIKTLSSLVVLLTLTACQQTDNRAIDYQLIDTYRCQLSGQIVTQPVITQQDDFELDEKGFPTLLEGQTTTTFYFEVHDTPKYGESGERCARFFNHDIIYVTLEGGEHKLAQYTALNLEYTHRIYAPYCVTTHFQLLTQRD